MAKFTYSGDDGRYYPFLNGGTTVNDGDVVDCDVAPDDGRFTPASKSDKRAVASTGSE